MDGKQEEHKAESSEKTTETKEEVKKEDPPKKVSEEAKAEPGTEAKEQEKKKKKKKKKKAKHQTEKVTKEETKKLESDVPEGDKTTPATRAQDNSTFRILGNWADGPYKQTIYPTIPIDDQFPDGKYPLGVVVEYPGEYSHRMSSPEEKKKEEPNEFQYQCYRKAAECHKQVRHFAQRIIKPGKSLSYLATEIENAVRRIIKANKSEAGLAFPCGCSVNNCAAHFTPNPGDTKILQKGDVVKFDFGTHYNGYLIDCAFTVAFDPIYDELLKASKEATLTGVKEAGIDARIDEIGGEIQEVIESHEVTIRGKTHKVRCVRNLQGHQVGHYKVHCGKSVPLVKGTSPVKMEEGEAYAIETFASTGKGYVTDDVDCSHFMKSDELKHFPIRNTRSKFLLKLIDENFSTLAFCRRWIEDLGFEK